MKIARRGEGSEWRSDPRRHRQPTSRHFLRRPVQIQRRSSMLSLRFFGSGIALAGTQGRPLLGAFPITNAPLPASFHNLLSQVGNYPVSEATGVYSLRLDYKFSANNQLMLRGGLDPSDVTGIQVNAQNQDFGQNAFSRTSTQNYHDGSIGAQDTWILRDSKINELRYQYSRRGLLNNFSRGPGGGDVAVNIRGFCLLRTRALLVPQPGGAAAPVNR